MFTFIGAIALLMILRCFVDKPEESTWPSVIGWTGAGLWLVITSPEVFSVKLGAGNVCLLRGIAHLGELTLLPWLESRGNKQGSEEEAGSTESVPPSVATPTVMPYARAEESPVAEPTVAEPVSAVAEEEEEEKNTLTPLNISTTTKTTESSTKKETYTRRYI